MEANTNGRTEGESEPQPQTYLTFKKQGDTMVIGAVVDGEEVFYANPDVNRSNPVIHAAVRTFGRRAWPDLADLDPEDENGGAFQ